MKKGFILPLVASLSLAVGPLAIWGADPPPHPKGPPPRGEGSHSTFRFTTPPLSAGTYYAVTQDGVRLSGIIASAGDTSFSRMPTTRAVPRFAHPKPRGRIVDPALRYERR